MIAYQTSTDGVYVGPVECDESPLQPGVFLVPGGAVTVEPPKFSEEQFAVWNGEKWVVENHPEPKPEPEPEPEPEPTREFIEQQRQEAYRATADPLFFQWQRGEATEQEWLDAVQAVKTANPYPTQPKA